MRARAPTVSLPFGLELHVTANLDDPVSEHKDEEDTEIGRDLHLDSDGTDASEHNSDADQDPPGPPPLPPLPDAPIAPERTRGVTGGPRWRLFATGASA